MRKFPPVESNLPRIRPSDQQAIVDWLDEYPAREDKLQQDAAMWGLQAYKVLDQPTQFGTLKTPLDYGKLLDIYQNLQRLRKATDGTVFPNPKMNLVAVTRVMSVVLSQVELSNHRLQFGTGTRLYAKKLAQLHRKLAYLRRVCPKTADEISIGSGSQPTGNVLDAEQFRCILGSHGLGEDPLPFFESPISLEIILS